MESELEIRKAEASFQRAGRADLGEPTTSSTGEYQIVPVEYHNIYNCDAALLVLPPGVSTRIIKVVSDEHIFIDLPIQGKGWFLKYTPETGDLKKYEVENWVEFQTYKKGDYVVWIAGKDGLAVLSTIVPGFDNLEDVEVGVEIDSEELPQDFKDAYHRFKNSVSS